MNLYNIWVSLSEMSDKTKNIDLFYDILIFFRCTCMVFWAHTPEARAQKAAVTWPLSTKLFRV